MDKFRRFIASLGVTAILSTLVVSTAFAAPPYAHGADDWWGDAVDSLVDLGVDFEETSGGDFDVVGDGMLRDNSFRVMAQALAVPESTSSSAHFADMPTSDSNFSFVQGLWEFGLIDGLNDGQPDSNGDYLVGANFDFRRQEFAKVAVDALGVPLGGTDAGDVYCSASAYNFSDVNTASDYALPYLEAAFAYGLIEGDSDSTTVRPLGPLNQADLAVIVDRLVNSDGEIAVSGCEILEEDVSPDPTPSSGLTVNDTSDEIESEDPIIVDATNGGQSKADFASFELSAGSSGSVTVDELAFTRGGVSNDNDIDNGYIYVDGVLVGEMLNISDKVATFRDSGGMFTVPAGTTVDVMLKVDVNKDIGGSKTIDFMLDADDIVSNATSVSGDSMVEGPTRETALVTDLGKLEVANVSSSSAVDPGEEDFELWRFKLVMSNQEGQVDRIVVTDIGTIDSNDLDNIYLEYLGVPVTDEMSMGSDKKLVFDLSDDPLVFTSGETKNLSIRGNVVGGTNRNFRLSIQNSYDIDAMDTDYGVQIKPLDEGGTVGSYSVVQASSATTINTGSMTISRSDDSPVNRVATGLTNEVLAEFDFEPVGENVKVTSLSISCLQSDNLNLQDGKIYVNGTQVGTTSDLNCDVSDDSDVTAGGDDTTFTFSGNNFVVIAGETAKVQVRADTKSAADGTNLATSSDTIQINLNAGSSNAQGKVSLTTISTGSSTGNSLTLSGVAVTVTENTGYLDGAYDSPMGVLGGDIKVGSFTIEGSAAASSQITQLAISDDFEAATYDGNTSAIEAQGAITSAAGEIIDGLTLAQVRAISVGDTLDIDEDGGDSAGDCTFTVTAKSEAGADSTITGTAVCGGNDFADNDDVDITDSSTTSMADLFQNLRLVNNATGEQMGTTKGTLTDTAATAYTFTLSPYVELGKSDTMVVDVYAESKTNVSLFNYNNDSDGLFTPTSVTATTTTGTDASATPSVSVQAAFIAPSGSLTISGESTPNAAQLQMGDLEQELARFKFEAGEAEPVNVEQVVIDNLGGSTNVYNLTLTDADTGDELGVVETIDSTNYDGVAIFDEVWTIPKGGSKVMIVTGSISGFAGAVEDAATDLQLQVLSTDGEGSNNTIARGSESTSEITETLSSATGQTHFVFRTTLSGAVNSSTPTGNQTPAAEQKVLSVDLTAGSKRAATFRQGYEEATCIVGAGTPTITVAHGATAATEISGSACEFTAIDTANDSVAYLVGAGTLDDYSYVSFWFSENDGGTGTMSDFADWSIVTDTDATGATAANTTALAASHCNAGSVTQLVDDLWYHCVVPLPVATDSADTHLVFLLDTDGGQHTDDDYFLDEVYLFNDSITVDLATNSKFFDEDVADAQGSPAVLKSGSTTLATGFTSIQADSGSDDTNNSAKVVFIPIDQDDGTDYSEFTVNAGATRTMDVFVDTFSLLETSGNDDLLTPSIDLGSGSATSANNGDIEWYDDAIVNTTIPDSIGWVYNANETTLQPSSSLVY